MDTRADHDIYKKILNKASYISKNSSGMPSFEELSNAIYPIKLYIFDHIRSIMEKHSRLFKDNTNDINSSRNNQIDFCRKNEIEASL